MAGKPISPQRVCIDYLGVSKVITIVLKSEQGRQKPVRRKYVKRKHAQMLAILLSFNRKTERQGIQVVLTKWKKKRNQVTLRQ
jgi:hypothetical protein